MTSFKHVMEFQKEADHHIEKLGACHAENNLEVILMIGIEAICQSILAVGVRVDYALNSLGTHRTIVEAESDKSS